MICDIVNPTSNFINTVSPHYPQDDVCHLSCDPLPPVNCKLNVFATTFIPSAHYVNDKECYTESELTSNTSLSLNEVRRKYSNKIILAHININSIRNKFEMLCEFIDGNIDILLISETKIDESFPPSQFFIPGFSTPFRYDRSGNAGGLLFYVRQDIPAKIIKTDYIKTKLELFFVEIIFFFFKSG